MTFQCDRNGSQKLEKMKKRDCEIERRKRDGDERKINRKRKDISEKSKCCVFFQPFSTFFSDTFKNQLKKDKFEVPLQEVDQLMHVNQL